MSTKVLSNPSIKNTRGKAQRGKARTQKRAASTGQFLKVHGRNPVRMDEPQVYVHIRVFGIELNQDTRTSIRRRLDRRLKKFARSIERVSVRLKDVNGPRGGVDQVCRIKVVLRNLPSIVYEEQDISLDAAVGGALAGAERAVRRTLRRRRKPIRKGPPMARAFMTKSNKE